MNSMPKPMNSMPKPMARSGHASRPNGMAMSAIKAMGMIRRLTSGAAIMLARRPKWVMR
jgi:hypothetical protein